jgi:superfamily II DNA or RNA helicase
VGNIFSKINVSIDGLRDCQKEACRIASEHYSIPNSEKHTLIQLPTGTGKSALIAALPFCLSANRVLILVPNLDLVTQMVKDLDIIDSPDKNAYRKFGLLTEQQIDDNEMYVMPLNNKANRSDLSQHQIIVANYQQLANVEKWFGKNKDLIDLIIIDEAHHQAANTYQELIKFFDAANIIGLTATPFRSDGKKVDGENIYTYHFSDAVRKGYIRNIKVSNVSPSVVKLLFNESGSSKTYTLDQLINEGIKEQAWFNRGVALSQECCNSIADLAVEKLNELRRVYPETNHQIIAEAMSIRHAREYIKTAFERHNLRVGMVSSDIEDKPSNEKTKLSLQQGKIDVIINIGMLGEGFNQPSLGVAAIFRPFKTLNPYIQFIGRVLRENKPAKYCYVVSHLGLNQVRRFEEFKLFDKDDQNFMDTLFVNEPDPTVDSTFIDDDSDEDNNENNRSEPEDVTVSQSGDLQVIGAAFINEDKVSNISEQYYNLTPEEKEAFLKRLGLDGGTIEKLKPYKAKPIQERRTKKNNLNEHAKSITTDILRELKLKPYDRNFNPLNTNFAWVQKQVNRWINKDLNIKTNERNNLSLAQLNEYEAQNRFDDITKKGIEYYKNKLSQK